MGFSGVSFGVGFGLFHDSGSACSFEMQQVLCTDYEVGGYLSTQSTHTMNDER